MLASTGIAGFWAFWGAAETFHEGWYYREFWRNVTLSIVQYFPAMLISIVAGLLALWRPAVGVAVHATAAIGAVWLFRQMPVGMNFVVWPLAALAAAHAVGRPHYRVSYDGRVRALPKSTRRGYFAARCVKGAD